MVGRIRPWSTRRVLRGLVKYGPEAIADCALVCVVYVLAVGVRTGLRSETSDVPLTLAFALFAGTAQVAANVVFNVYWRNWSVAALEDLIAVGKSTIAVVLMLVAINAVSAFHYLPNSSILTGGVLAFVAESLLKLRPRWPEMMRAAIGRHLGSEEVIVIGAGALGQLLARDLGAGSRYRIACFVDDDQRKWGTYVRGIRVSGAIDHLGELIARHRPTMVVLAVSSPEGTLVRRVVQACNGSDVRIRAVSSLAISDQTAAVRPIEIDELLEREAVDLDTPAAHAYLVGRTILVTGAAGSIGSEITRQVSRFGPRRLLLLDTNESGLHSTVATLPEGAPAEILLGDIRDRGWLQSIFTQERPEVIFHAAAYKHVTIVEQNPLAAIATNVIGTANVLDAAQGSAEQLVFISTDKAVEPLNLLGLTKRFGELLTQAHAAARGQRFTVVRFGNVLGSVGSVVPIFTRQIDRGGPVTVTDPEVTRYFMSISEAAGLVIQAGAIARPGDVLVLDMGLPVPILDLAKKMIRLRGLRAADIPITFIGLRHGEKLHEELLFPDERANRSEHARVLRVEDAPAAPSLALLRIRLAEIESRLGDLDADGAVAALRDSLARRATIPLTGAPAASGPQA